MAEDFSNKRLLIWDEGLYCDFATVMAKKWGSVQLYKPWKESAPTSRALMVGNGLDNVERVLDFWDAVPGADLIAFPDCYGGDVQQHLVEMGARVWGSRRAERYEWDRKLFREALKEVGLPVAPYKVIKGITALRKHLMDHNEQVVKISVFRGDMETFCVPNYRVMKSRIDWLESYYGPISEYVEFIIEDQIECEYECGYDGICVDGEYSDGFIDYESKNLSCLVAVKPYLKLPDVVRDVNDKFAKILKRENYRGPFGTEIRVAEDGTPYFIDATCRTASPPGESLWVLLENLPEVMYYGAEGDLVQQKWAAKYACEIMLYMTREEQQWQEVSIPDENKDYVMLNSYCKVDDMYYPVAAEGKMDTPHLDDEIGCAIGIGNTIEEAIDMAKENAESVEGFRVHYDISAVYDGLKAAKEGEENGIHFADDIPEPESVLEEA